MYLYYVVHKFTKKKIAHCARKLFVRTDGVELVVCSCCLSYSQYLSVLLLIAAYVSTARGSYSSRAIHPVRTCICFIFYVYVYSTANIIFSVIAVSRAVCSYVIQMVLYSDAATGESTQQKFMRRSPVSTMTNSNLYVV